MPMPSTQKQTGVLTTPLTAGADTIVPASPLMSPSARAKYGPQAGGGELFWLIASGTQVKQNWSMAPVAGQKNRPVVLRWQVSGLPGSAGLESAYVPSSPSVTYASWVAIFDASSSVK